MSISFKRGTIYFDPTRGQKQHEVGAVVFPSKVTQAEVAIAGYDIRYNNGDHHILRQIIDPVVESIQESAVFVRIDFLLRDSSGNIDDPFSGTIHFLVIADLEQPPLRSLTSLATGATIVER